MYICIYIYNLRECMNNTESNKRNVKINFLSYIFRFSIYNDPIFMVFLFHYDRNITIRKFEEECFIKSY